MQHSEWHRDMVSNGRQYFLPKELHVKYEETDVIVERIVEKLNEFIHIESAIRITTDSPYAEPERAVLALPGNPHHDEVIHNFAHVLHSSIMGYYISADPKTYHFGISNWILEGNMNSFFCREIEFLLRQFQNREDIAGRLIKDLALTLESDSISGENFIADTLQGGIDITAGFRISIFGNRVNSNSIFIPIDVGATVIDKIYSNIEQLIIQNFSTYDETNEQDYLKVTNTLIFKEFINVLKRARQKENTRKKILNGIVFPTSLTENLSQLYGRKIGDPVYDTLNHIRDERIRAASDRSRELYNAFMIRATEMTNDSVDTEQLSITDGGDDDDGGNNEIKVPSPPNKSKVATNAETKKETAESATTARRPRSGMKRDALQEL